MTFLYFKLLIFLERYNLTYIVLAIISISWYLFIISRLNVNLLLNLFFVFKYIINTNE